MSPNSLFVRVNGLMTEYCPLLMTGQIEGNIKAEIFYVT